MRLKFIQRGDLIPRFYGVAWFDWKSGYAVCLPLGFNVLASLARTAYFTLRHAGRIVPTNAREAYAQGLRDGRAAAQGEMTSEPQHIEPTTPWPRR